MTTRAAGLRARYETLLAQSGATPHPDTTALLERIADKLDRAERQIAQVSARSAPTEPLTPEEFAAASDEAKQAIQKLLASRSGPKAAARRPPPKGARSNRLVPAQSEAGPLQGTGLFYETEPPAGMSFVVRQLAGGEGD